MSVMIKKETQSGKIDLSWVGSKVKLAEAGICPFCKKTVIVDEPHKCEKLPPIVNNLDAPLIKEFSETKILLVGPSYFTIQAANRIKEKYPDVKIYIIYCPS